jgi:hypothetical protein
LKIISYDFKFCILCFFFYNVFKFFGEWRNICPYHIKKKKKNFSNEKHVTNQKNKQLSKKLHSKTKSSPLKNFARKIFSLLKKTNAFVTQSPEFDANSVKNHLFFLVSFFVGVGNVLVNHFFFFFQLYDHSLFSSMSSIV